MKKVLDLANFLLIAAIVLAIGFAVRLGADYYKYSTIALNTSTPLYVFIVERTAEFLLPSAVCFGVSRFLKRHRQENE